MSVTTLFLNETGDGDSSIIDIKDGGYRLIKATGIFGGAIITLNADFVDDDFAPLVEDNIDQTLTKPGVLNIQPFKTGCRFKATISGASGTTNITLKILS